MRKHISLLIIFTSVLNFSFSQNLKTSLTGQIVDASTKKAIGFADILVYPKDSDNPLSHSSPDANGYFSVQKLHKGEYDIIVKLMGYDVYSKPGIKVDGTNRTINIGTIELKPLNIGLAEVEVVKHRKQVVYKLDKKVIEASTDILSSGGTAVDILENTPSVRVDAEGEVSFRGSTGFAVYIDGKPSVFGGSQGLEQVPAGQIENIEIITTPSARQDTDGDVGIINIITKKHFNNGLSGMANITGSTVLSRGGNFLLNLQDSTSRWYFGGNWNDHLRKGYFNQEKTTIVSGVTTTSHSDGPRESNNYNYSLKAGWQRSLENTTFNLDLSGGYGGRSRDGDLDYTELKTGDNGLLSNGDYNSRDEYNIHETYFQGTAAFVHCFDKKEHSLSGSFYLKYGGDALEYFQSDLFDEQGQRQQGHRAWEDEHRWTSRANLDYVRQFRDNGKLEAGYQYYSYLEDGDYSMQFWDPDIKQFYWRDDIYNTFYFKRGLHSLYSILADSYKGFEYQAGVRAEHTHTVLRSSKNWANRTKNRMEFFPSVHLGYNFSGKTQVLASYSRRTTRPQLFYMEPYITYRDYYTAETGNPDIRPEYINSFEANFKKDIGQHSISTGIFHRNRKDKIERLRVPFEAGVTLDSMANVGHDYSTGIELSGQFSATKHWKTSVNGSLYRYRVENEFKTTGGEEKSNNYEIAINNVFDAWKCTRIQIDGNFVGPSVTTQGKTDSFWYFSLGIKQQLIKRKFTGTFTFRDMFNSARYVSNIETANLISLTKIRPHYPLVSLVLCYTFNNYKDKSAPSSTNNDLFEGTHH